MSINIDKKYMHSIGYICRFLKALPYNKQGCGYGSGTALRKKTGSESDYLEEEKPGSRSNLREKNVSDPRMTIRIQILHNFDISFRPDFEN